MVQAAIKHHLPIKVYPGRKRPSVLDRGCVLTIGAFDGVHLGHQEVINQLRQHAAELDLPAVAMTFRPDPAEFFSSNARASLMSWRDKVRSLKMVGADFVACLPFDKKVSNMSAESFVADLLVEQLGVKFLMIGDDFRFGSGREGGFDALCEMAPKYGFEVARSKTFESGGARVSSTRIRECLANGELQEAETLLGRPYAIRGKVVSGKRLGRTLGFPTANIPLRCRKVPLKGVFAVRTELAHGQPIPSVANLGVRPAVNSLEQPLLEVHLLDFDPKDYGLTDLYGEKIKIIFEKKLRDEQGFNSLDELKEAIAKDLQNARDWFSAH